MAADKLCALRRNGVKEAFRIALQSLWANKLRTVLTLLGVVIGVASVIAVVTLVNGANTYVTTKFTSYGADVFTVSKMPQLITSSEDYERFQKRKDILFPDYTLRARKTASAASASAPSRPPPARSFAAPSPPPTPASAATPGRCPRSRTSTSLEGRGFTDSDEEHASHVAIIGTDIVDNLFAGIDPLGQELRVDGTPYTIIGVGEKQGSTFGAEPGQLGRRPPHRLPEDLRHLEDAHHLHQGGLRRCPCSMPPPTRSAS